MAGTDILAGVSAAQDSSYTTGQTLNAPDEVQGAFDTLYSVVGDGTADGLAVKWGSSLTPNPFKLILCDASGNILRIADPATVSANGWQVVDITPIALSAAQEVFVCHIMATTPAFGYMNIQTDGSSFGNFRDTSGSYASPPDPINNAGSSTSIGKGGYRVMGTFGGGTEITGAEDTKTITAQDATVQFGTPTNINATAASLSLTENSLTLSLTVIGVEDDKSIAAQDAVTSLHRTIPGSEDTKTITANQAAITLGANIVGAEDTKTITANAASLQYDPSYSPNSVALDLQTQAATVTGTENADLAEVEQPTGGYGAQNAYDAYQQRKRARDRERRERQKEIQRIKDETDREIARLMHKDADEKARIEDVKKLVRDMDSDLKELNERVSLAYMRALNKQTYSSLMALERELARAVEEEEFLFLAMLL